jgi:hypothetical protein
MNASDYYISSECYSDYYLMWMAIFKVNKSCFRVDEKREIYDSIGEKLATILGDLHLILVYYRLYHPHA